jgi:hypothetical protein
VHTSGLKPGLRPVRPDPERAGLPVMWRGEHGRERSCVLTHDAQPNDDGAVVRMGHPEWWLCLSAGLSAAQIMELSREWGTRSVGVLNAVLLTAQTIELSALAKITHLLGEDGSLLKPWMAHPNKAEVAEYA